MIPKGIDLHGFVDDHEYRNSFTAKSRDKEAARIKELKECARNIKTRMDKNQLKMTNSKTKCIIYIKMEFSL